MTREDIMRMAREAGLHEGGASSRHPYYNAQGKAIERFAALVAAAEREAICQIVYGLCVSDNNAQEIVNAIRARGSK
jgi:predicted ATPase